MDVTLNNWKHGNFFPIRLKPFYRRKKNQINVFLKKKKYSITEINGYKTLKLSGYTRNR